MIANVSIQSQTQKLVLNAAYKKEREFAYLYISIKWLLLKLICLRFEHTKHTFSFSLFRGKGEEPLPAIFNDGQVECGDMLGIHKGFVAGNG